MVSSRLSYHDLVLGIFVVPPQRLLFKQHDLGFGGVRLDLPPARISGNLRQRVVDLCSATVEEVPSRSASVSSLNLEQPIFKV